MRLVTALIKIWFTNVTNAGIESTSPLSRGLCFKVDMTIYVLHLVLDSRVYCIECAVSADSDAVDIPRKYPRLASAFVGELKEGEDLEWMPCILYQSRKVVTL